MRSRLISSALLSLVVASLVLFGPEPAYADTVCQVVDPRTGECQIWVEAPGAPSLPPDDGPKDTGHGHPCFWDGRPQHVFDPPPGPVDCSSKYGYWSNSMNCYIQLVDPQPPAGDPNWKGHLPGDGAIYHCYQPQTDLYIYFWAQDPPPNSGAGPTPVEVAKLAISDMHLTAINVGITPEPGPDSIGLVGMPVWLWVQNPGGHTYGPITASASAGGITVTATARVHKITWVMGDGSEVACRTEGTPYQPSFGKQHSPDCGHVYTQSSAHERDGKFTVTAVSDWVVTWSGAGQTGTIRLNGLQRSVEIAIGEAQVLVN